MNSIGSYRLVEPICATAGGKLYVARHAHDGSTVLLKTPDHDHTGPGASMRIEHEYALLHFVDVPEIIRPIALHDDGVRPVLVLEYFGGECLDTVLARERRLPLPGALHLACQLARALAALHAAGIIHQDVRPANMLLARDGQQLRLADLSRATARERTAGVSAHPAAAGDWAYLSPEQTGRMNRQVDYQTDFYSLGITLYRLLSGQLPFQANDPPEWVHCHIARMPPAVSDLVPDIPQPVSDLVLKLLAKRPEDRYQSAAGLLADLQRCLAQWQAGRAGTPFTLGTRDIPDRLPVSHQLYGREREQAALLAAFESMATTGIPALVTVAGYSGIGKSALVNALQQPIVEQRGHFIAGKFDQYKRDIPYATLAQAFDGLVCQILGESDERIGQWRDAMLDALGSNGQLMVDLIPQLALIVGAQPSVPELAPRDAQRRFQRVFRHFLGVFAGPAHPLVLFLDDLQWLDAATLDLLADLATHPEVRYLLLVGAYRDNEVEPSHPLLRRLAAIRQAGGAVHDIVLAPLTPHDVGQLVAESLHCPPAQAMPLVQLLLEKTGGNPFFAIQFLTALAEEKLLAFDAGRGSWSWDLKRIHAKGYTDNVVDLMVGKLARLPQRTQDALTRFACLGNAADLAVLALVLGQAAHTVHAVLWEAERAGLVFRDDERYVFLHDRVQEAAYSLIPPAARAGIHLGIGRILAERLAPAAVGERIFDVVNQLNRGSALVTAQDERDRIAELNLQAGKRAKAAAAHASALAYLLAGDAMLGQDCWERCHALSFALTLQRAECEFLTGALEEAAQRLAALAPRAMTTVERAAVACLRVELYTTLNEGARAIVVALDYLRQLGIDWPLYPTHEQARCEYEQIWSRLGQHTLEDLVALPLMREPALLATMDVLLRLVTAAWLMESNLPFLAACRAVNLSIEHGNCDSSGYAYAWLGMSLAMGGEPHFGDHRTGIRLGELGCKLVEGRGLGRFQARIYLLSGAHIMIWGRHLQTGRDLLRRAFDAARQNGDLTYGAYCCNNLNANLLAAGDPLCEVQREAEQGLAFVQKMQFTNIIYTIASQLGFIRMLRGLTAEFGCLNDAQFDELEMEHRFAGNPDPGLAWAEGCYWVRKLQARFFAGDAAGAIGAAQKADRLVRILRGSLETADYHFYAALSRAALCQDGQAGREHVHALAAHHAQLQAWAANCPENFDNRAALAAAEIARIDGRGADAMRLYEQAARSARSNGFVHHEAIAHELAARFCLAQDWPTSASAHLLQARDGYAQWGAHGKVRQLEKQYRQLRVPSQRSAASPVEVQPRLDLLSVAKASQAISGCIVLDELIDTLMRIVLENAGAQCGCLLLARDEALVLAAEAQVEQLTVQVRLHRGQALPEARLPLTMLQYVRRSREPVLLMDVAEAHPFAADPYFAQGHPQSVLCLPILRQAKLIGMLYLEHHLLTHAFSPDRIEVLELLSAQAAISLENAQLYADVQESHARIRRLVESNIIGVLFWDMQGNITEANDAFLRMTGYARADLASGALRWLDLMPSSSRQNNARAVEELRRTGSFTPFEKEYRRKDGSRIPILIGGTVFEKSRETGVAFVLDLSERKQAEAEREARHVAEAANRAKSAFLANMSHELRTPLNGILGYAQILQRDPALGARQRTGVDVIRNSGEHLLTLINDILDLAKIEAGKMELYPADIPLGRFMRTIADLIRVKAEQKGLELVCDLAPDLPSWIRADEKRLRQILLNLLSNAVKFTDEGAVTLRVRFRPPARLCCDVHDTGIGVAADRLEAIFEPFEQTGDAQRRLAGTGLGLTISRQYVHLMDGNIEVESRLGQGSTFRFEVQAEAVRAATPVAPSNTVTGYAGRRKTILVVDDIAENRAVVTDLLTSLGFAMAEAANGRAGVELAQRVRPDLILMDIAMPDLDGLAATQLLRQLDRFRDLPIVAMSASVSASDGAQCLAAGMNAFLAKPLDADRLLEQLARLLGLEWTYEGAPTAPVPSQGAMVTPPAPEMEALHRLARLGNMGKIIAQAERLAALDERYRPFASELGALASRYQSRDVLRLVEEHWRAGLPEDQGTGDSIGAPLQPPPDHEFRMPADASEAFPRTNVDNTQTGK